MAIAVGTSLVAGIAMMSHEPSKARPTNTLRNSGIGPGKNAFAQGLSSFSLLLEDGRRMQIVRDGITGLLVSAQELWPGRRFDVRITRRDLGL